MPGVGRGEIEQNRLTVELVSIDVPVQQRRHLAHSPAFSSDGQGMVQFPQPDILEVAEHASRAEITPDSKQDRLDQRRFKRGERQAGNDEIVALRVPDTLRGTTQETNAPVAARLP